MEKEESRSRKGSIFTGLTSTMRSFLKMNKSDNTETMQISEPFNVVHVDHVRADNRTSTGFEV